MQAAGANHGRTHHDVRFRQDGGRRHRRLERRVARRRVASPSKSLRTCSGAGGQERRFENTSALVLFSETRGKLKFIFSDF